MGFDTIQITLVVVALLLMFPLQQKSATRASRDGTGGSQQIFKSNKNEEDQNIVQECVRQELQDAQVIPEQSPIINKYIPPPNNGPPSIPPHGRLAYKDRPRFKDNIKIKTTVKENKLELTCAKLKAGSCS